MQIIVSFLKNNWYSKSFLNTVKYSTQPELVIEKPQKAFFWVTLFRFLLFLATYMVINLIIGMFNLNEMHKYESVMKQIFEADELPWFLYYTNVYPYNVFFLGFAFLLLQFYTSVAAYSFLWFLGEKDRSIIHVSIISLNSSVYFILCLFLVLIAANLGPSDWQIKPFRKTFYTGIQAMFLFAGLLFSSISFMRMSAKIFRLNWGKTLIVWLSPTFYFFFIFFLFIYD